MNLVLLGVFAYIFAQLIIGVLVSRRIRNDTDYFLAGRSLGYPLATFSIFATWFGAETCIGAAAEVYSHGITGATAEPFAYAVCLLLMAFVFAVPLWNRKLVTLADLFRERFSPGVEKAAAFLMIPTSLLWGAAQIRAFGQVLASSAAFDVRAGITAAAAVVIIYTVSGGLLADAVTDLVQGIALIIGLVIFAVFAFWNTDSTASWIPSVTLYPDSETGPLQVLEQWAIPICGSVVAQELISRISSSRSPRVAQRSTIFATAAYLALGMIPILLGWAGRSLFPGLSDAEQILPRMAQTYLGPVLYVLFAGALVSAILSTVDSCLLVAASLLSNNLVSRLKPEMNDRQRLVTARAGVVLFGIVAYILALSSESVFGLVEEASALGSAGIFVLLVFGLFSEVGGRWSAYGALAAGTAVWLAGSHWLGLETPYLWSLFSALAVYVALSPLKSAAPPPSPVSV